MTLLLVFFSQMVKPEWSESRDDPDELIRRRRRIFVAAGIGLGIFFLTNVTCAVLTKYLFWADWSDWLVDHVNQMQANIVLARVVINDGLFMTCAACLSACIVKLTKRPSARVAFEAKDIGVGGAISLAILISVVFITRGIYNFTAIFFKACPSFGYGWINVSDQADLRDLSDDMAYFSFGMVLFWWECLPTTMIVLFFRVKTRAYTSKDAREYQSRVMGSLPGGIVGSSGGASYFFDNRNRYNSIDDVSTSPRSPIDIYTINPTGGGGAGFGVHSSSYGRLSHSQQRMSPVGSLGVGSFTRLSRDANQYPAFHANGGVGGGGGRIASPAAGRQGIMASTSGSPATISSSKSAPNLAAPAKRVAEVQRQGARLNQDTNSIIEEDGDESIEVTADADQISEAGRLATRDDIAVEPSADVNRNTNFPC